MIEGLDPSVFIHITAQCFQFLLGHLQISLQLCFQLTQKFVDIQVMVVVIVDLLQGNFVQVEADTGLLLILRSNDIDLFNTRPFNN
ncbi:hypothetical protein D3C86_1451610 [compost metagenome]